MPFKVTARLNYFYILDCYNEKQIKIDKTKNNQIDYHKTVPDEYYYYNYFFYLINKKFL